jgi:hypothetical protein
MKRLFQLFSAALVCGVLIGCAHPITMNPDLATVKGDGSTLINKTVGYHISDASRAIEVTTPGGGGDKVRYFPYRDIESGFYKALGEVFKDVTKVADPKDLEALRKSGINLLVTPEITTTSFSDSVLTWPPTQFTVALTCTVTDAGGQVVDTVKVTGEGRASFDEFKSNFSLAAVRASNDALSRLIKALRESSSIRKP